ncbi:hypothetical protein Bca4012_001470 [Brassica carinata]|uniref:Uncharacterized protein n=1 Tax=Brassica oleracea TaxID=3712 RepID=A0A3P6AUZ9_BRAOL|nr:unnamed protein product [Brassica oleracea]
MEFSVRLRKNLKVIDLNGRPKSQTLILYGTHCSRATFLGYPGGVRVVFLQTINLIHVDWNNKSQGLWIQDFPWEDNGKDLSKGCEPDLTN